MVYKIKKIRLCSLCKEKHYCKSFCKLHYRRSTERILMNKKYKSNPVYKEKQRLYMVQRRLNIELVQRERQYDKVRRSLKEYKIMSKEQRMSRRKEVLTHYGSKCVCCGESRFEFLAIDHINGGGTKHRKEVGRDIVKWAIENKFPKDLRILCHNCNQSIGYYGYCPHEKERELQSDTSKTA